MSKKITTTATVAYILDPDLAVPDVIDRKLAITYGLKNSGVPVSFKNKKSSIKARGPYKKEKTDALNIIIDEIAPFIDLLSAPSLMSEDIVKNNMVFVKAEITSSEYSSLNIFGKQLYVKATDALYDRFPVGSEYAKLLVPPPGRFGKLSAIEPKNVTIVARNKFASRIPKGYRRMLARLSDGSLLEFYTVGSELSESKVEALFNKIIVQEPVILKKFILSKALTNELARPAYSIDNIIAIIDGNDRLPRTPNVVEEVTGYYEEAVPIELSTSTVLDLPPNFPTTIFYAHNSTTGPLTVKPYTALLRKYAANANKGGVHKTAYMAMDNINNSRAFDTSAEGGSKQDILHPGVLESILDEYIAGKSRSDFIKMAIELLAKEKPLSLGLLSGYKTACLPYGSELSSFVKSVQKTVEQTPAEAEQKAREEEIARLKKLADPSSGGLLAWTAAARAAREAAIKRLEELEAEARAARQILAPDASKNIAVVMSTITATPKVETLTGEQLFNKGKEALIMYLPRVF